MSYYNILYASLIKCGSHESVAISNSDAFKQGAMTMARIQKEDESKRGRRRNHQRVIPTSRYCIVRRVGLEIEYRGLFRIRRLVGLVQAWSRPMYQTEVRPFYELLVSNVVGQGLTISECRCTQSRRYVFVVCLLTLLKYIMNESNREKRPFIRINGVHFSDDSLVFAKLKYHVSN